jgi:biotin transport system substrate-specific component
MLATVPAKTLSDVIGPATRTRDVVLVLAGSLAMGLISQFEIHIPWSPVPVTLQSLGVFLIGAAFGSRRAALTMLAYLAEGAAGMPFFAGGAGGPAHLLGPTGGYLIGFAPAAFVVGWLAERGWDRSPLTAFAANAAGAALLFACGLAQLAFFVPRDTLLAVGLYPFLLGSWLKMAAAALALSGLWALLERAHLAPRR